MPTSTDTPSALSPYLGYGRRTDKTLPGRAVNASRGLLYVMLALLASAIIWSAVTKLDVVVNANGRLRAEGESLRVSAPEAGVVQAVNVAVGEHVVAGARLVQLDDYKYEAEITRLAADVEAARAQADRSRKSEAAAAVDDPFLLQQARLQTAQDEARLRSLDAQLGEARQARDRMTLRSPVAGKVTRLAVTRPGASLTAGEIAAEIAPDGRPLVAEVLIPNSSMRGILPGMPVRLRFDALPSQDYGYAAGHLVTVDPDADQQGFYKGIVALDQSDLHGPRGSASLRLGLIADARIIIERSSVLSFVLRPLRQFREPITVNR